MHTHERGRRTDAPITIEYAANFSPGRFGYLLGFGTLVTLITRSVLARTRFGRLPILKPFLSRSAAITLTIISSAWMLRILVCLNTNLFLRPFKPLVYQHPLLLCPYCSFLLSPPLLLHCDALMNGALSFSIDTCMIAPPKAPNNSEPGPSIAAIARQ